MLKIYEKNWDLRTVKRYWKQFEAWVTDLQNKYWHDAFFRTEFNVIVLQIVFAVVLSLLVAASFNYLYKDILQTLLNGIVQSIRSNNTVNGQTIFDSIQVVKAKNFLGFFSITVSVILLFSYFIAKMTLTPARQALTSQKRFVSDIAHELRTPLSVIKTNSEVALLDDTLDKNVRKIFESNIEELDRTSEIINNLLTFNKLIRPEHIKYDFVDLGLIVDTSTKKLTDLAKSKEVKLLIKKMGPRSVWGNATALEQIASNLIKNAINYTRPRGTVTTTVAPDYRGNIMLLVEDTGIGISSKDLSHIFEPFYRAERSRNRALGGSGLGLTIVNELVKLHMGEITIRSELNRGTKVMILFPYKKQEVYE